MNSYFNFESDYYSLSDQELSISKFIGYADRCGEKPIQSPESWSGEEVRGFVFADKNSRMQHIVNSELDSRGSFFSLGDLHKRIVSEKLSAARQYEIIEQMMEHVKNQPSDSKHVPETVIHVVKSRSDLEKIEPAEDQLIHLFLGYAPSIDDAEIIEENPSIRKLSCFTRSTEDWHVSVLSQLTSLEEISFSGTSITPTSIPDICQLPNLKVLELSECNLNSPNRNLFDQLTNLEWLNLRNCRLHPQTSFDVMQNLDRLDISGTRLDTDVLNTIPERLPNLNELRVSLTAIGTTAVNRLIHNGAKHVAIDFCPNAKPELSSFTSLDSVYVRGIDYSINELLEFSDKHPLVDIHF